MNEAQQTTHSTSSSPPATAGKVILPDGHDLSAQALMRLESRFVVR